VQAACEATRSPVVYCHNDLLAPNILWAREHEEDRRARALLAFFLRTLRTQQSAHAARSPPTSS